MDNFAKMAVFGLKLSNSGGTVLQPETIVATRALVCRKFTEGHCVIAGIPAEIVKRGVRWDRELL